VRRASIVLLLSLISACASASGDVAASGGAAVWGDREPVLYAIVVAEVLDDLGSPPPVVFVVDRICAEAGQLEPSELECGPTIPTDGRAELAAQLERYAAVEFVASPEDATQGDGVRDGGLLFWFGPPKERKDGEVRVGATYASALSDEAALGVNLALENEDGSWVVTGAAGLGGCPA
jgi:hypothetical protein